MRLPAANSERIELASRILVVAVVVIFIAWMIPLGALPYPPKSPYSDAALAHWPSANFLRESVLLHHQWPFWNPLHMLGQPFAANPLNKVWYPPQWLVLILPTTIHLNILIYLHAIWGALGMMAWARAAKVHIVAELFAVLAWGLAPKLVAHLGAGHLDLWYAAAWVPWLLWAAIRMRAHTSVKHSIILGLIASFLVLADVRMAFYSLPFTLFYVMVLLPGEAVSEPNHVALWMLSGLVLIGLTAIQTIPLLAWGRYLTRSHITPADAAVLSLPLNYLIGLVIPDIAGFQEFMTYAGIAVLILSISALRRADQKLIVGLWIALIISVLWSLGENGLLFLPIIRLIPAAAWFRVPSRAWFIVSLIFAMLSAYGLDSFCSRRVTSREQLLFVAAGFAGLIWLVASLALREILPDSVVGAILGVGLALFTTSVGIILVAKHIPKIAPTNSFQVGNILLFGTLVVSYGLLDVTLIVPRIPGRESQTVFSDPKGCQLIYSPSFDLLGPEYPHLRTLHGVDPFQLIRSANAITHAASVNADGYSVTAPPLPAETEDPLMELSQISPNIEALSSLGVTAVVSRFPILPASNTDQKMLDGFYDREISGGANAPISVCQPGPNRYEVLVSKGPSRRVVLSMAWAPGWMAQVNNASVQVNQVGALTGIDVPAGMGGKIVLTYQPIPDFVGMGVSGITIVSLFGWWSIRHIRGTRGLNRLEAEVSSNR